MMQQEPRPAWLIREENGAIGEARTRAFLLDRFWVLERSVDIEGADLIIQRRITAHSLLDRAAPRLGFVQAKYYADISTTQYVHREYVLDADQQPRSEFFVICHTGREDDARAFLLSSSDIASSFKETSPDHSMAGRFALPGKDVLVQRYQVLDSGNVLDRIDRALIEADFHKNRSFLSWALPRPSELPGPILSLYEEPIDNWWGDIPRGLDDLRKRARRAQYELEEVLEKLRSIEQSQDPEQALNVAEEIKHNWGNHVSLPDDLFDEDFLTVAKYHRRRYEELQKEGLLGAYAALRRSATSRLITDVVPQMPMARDQVYLLRVRYDSTSFLNVHLESRFESTVQLWPDYKSDSWSHFKDIPDTRGVLTAQSGDVEIYVVPGRYSYQDFVKGELVDTTGPWEERIKNVAVTAIGVLLERILLERFGE